ncbi:MAG: AI-2E family transporter [Vicinamibacterales bacterium]
MTVAQTRTRPDAAARMEVDVPWRTIVKILFAALLVWVVLTLRSALTVFLVAVVLAVALDPVVGWVERRRVPRAAGALLTILFLLAAIGSSVALAWSSLSTQGRFTLARAAAVERDLVTRFPALGEMVRSSTDAAGVSTWAARGVQVAHLLTSAAIVLAFGLILTIYLLVDGRRTYQWVRGYVPRRLWTKVDASAADARHVIASYVGGNAATSVFAAVSVFAGLSLLHVPAALVLALCAGLCDFVPVIGLVVALVPAVIMGLTVSPATALAVVALYLLSHAIENYFIAPRVYGSRLRLSSLAVILALAVGAELAGVVGALLALPLAAAYPSIERIWLADYLGPGVVAEHRRVEQAP